MADKILFFDGICVMCNRLIRFVLKHDKNGKVKFTTLQGETAQRYLPPHLSTDLKSVVYIDELGIHTESDAIIMLFIAMGGFLGSARCLRIFPKTLRDIVYRWIARNRYRLFGTTNNCQLLSPQEKLRILN